MRPLRLGVTHAVFRIPRVDRIQLTGKPLADVLDAAEEIALEIQREFRLGDVGRLLLSTTLQTLGMLRRRFWQGRVLVQLGRGMIESLAQDFEVAAWYCSQNDSSRGQRFSGTIDSINEGNVPNSSRGRRRGCLQGSGR